VFLSEHVNVLRSMIARNYPLPHRFICITDDAAGLDSQVEPVPMPETFGDVPSPQGEGFPSCYRRLWVFSRQAQRWLGDRIFCTDIDAVYCRDIRPIVDRFEDFIGWCDHRFNWNKIAGGCYMLKTGSMPHVWEEFDPLRSPALAFAAGNSGSDQGWMSYKMYPPPGKWTKQDGITKLRWTPKFAKAPPPHVRIAFTSGVFPPWHPDVQRQYPWVREHWR
jgi:hypothetical protein